MPTTLAALAAALLLTACLGANQSDDDGDTGYPEGCHYDCGLDYFCEDGVVSRPSSPWVPCKYAGDVPCELRELGTCPNGCAMSYAGALDFSGDDAWKNLCVQSSTNSDAADITDTTDAGDTSDAGDTTDTSDTDTSDTDH